MKRTEDRGQRTDDGLSFVFFCTCVAATEWTGIGHHLSQHTPYLLALVHQICMLFFRNIFTRQSGIKPVLGLSLFPIRIREFTQEMGGITSLLPGFCQIGANRSRRTPYLIRQRILLLFRKPLTNLENLLLKPKCLLINPQISETSNPITHPSIAPSVLRRPSSVVCRPSSSVSSHGKLNITIGLLAFPLDRKEALFYFL